MSATLSNKLLLYADGSGILVSEEILSYGMSLISDWLIDYKLSLHLGKTESILFGLSFNLNWA
jgi:hypothetical protein